MSGFNLYGDCRKGMEMVFSNYKDHVKDLLGPKVNFGNFSKKSSAGIGQTSSKSIAETATIDKIP